MKVSQNKTRHQLMKHVVFDHKRKLVHCQSFTMTVYLSEHAI